MPTSDQELTSVTPQDLTELIAILTDPIAQPHQYVGFPDRLEGDLSLVVGREITPSIEATLRAKAQTGVAFSPGANVVTAPGEYAPNQRVQVYRNDIFWLRGIIRLVNPGGLLSIVNNEDGTDVEVDPRMRGIRVAVN
jgi:hypothetical protein